MLDFLQRFETYSVFYQTDGRALLRFISNAETKYGPPIHSNFPLWQLRLYLVHTVLLMDNFIPLLETNQFITPVKSDEDKQLYLMLKNRYGAYSLTHGLRRYPPGHVSYFDCLDQLLSVAMNSGAKRTFSFPLFEVIKLHIGD